MKGTRPLSNEEIIEVQQAFLLAHYEVGKIAIYARCFRCGGRISECYR